MTKLIVKPIDPLAKGSYHERCEVLSLIDAAQAAAERKDVLAAVRTQLALEGILIRHLATDDGTTVEDALGTLSATEFDGLFAALVGSPSVGEASAESLDAPHGDIPSTSSRHGHKA